ncbi:MAG TPA: hypothetical protein VMX13_18600 [Sedimentisphaerales bacterium]|nr:hypothetical protein [Sedimentisphaerales bacterium]
MPTHAPDTIRQLAVIQEVTTAICLIQEGLISLNRLSGANDFAHLPVLLLADGFERLLKMIWCLDYLHRQGKFPDHRAYNEHCEHHKVAELLDQVTNIARQWDYSEQSEAARIDTEFLENDGDLRQIVELLEKYADGGRYYNINVIVGSRGSPDDDPICLFDWYCTDVLSRLPEWQDRTTRNNLGQRTEQDTRYVNQQITVLLQRFARALCRMFTPGRLGQPAQQMTGIIGTFLRLRDSDLGNISAGWFDT